MTVTLLGMTTLPSWSGCIKHRPDTAATISSSSSSLLSPCVLLVLAVDAGRGGRHKVHPRIILRTAQSQAPSAGPPSTTVDQSLRLGGGGGGGGEDRYQRGAGPDRGVRSLWAVHRVERENQWWQKFMYHVGRAPGPGPPTHCHVQPSRAPSAQVVHTTNRLLPRKPTRVAPFSLRTRNNSRSPN